MKRSGRIVGSIAALVFALAGCREEPPAALKFVALGDAPYGAPGENDGHYKALLGKISDAHPQLVIHVGDLHGHETCADARLDQLRGYLDAVKAPVLYTPGDNEWTDCRRTEVGPFDPLERLAYIRKSFFSDDMTLGAQPLTREHQGAQGYPENTRLRIGNIGIITVHVVGSNNNFSRSDLDAVAEFIARNAANVAWLEESFAAFGDADAVVVALHADMFSAQSAFLGFTKGWGWYSPFRDIGLAVGQQSSKLEKPVLLLYGDSHAHKAFQPFPEHRPYLHAIEVHGHPDIKAIEIAVRPDATVPFHVERVLTP